MRRDARSNPASRGAFSLVELIVAIGAFALVTISVATIFSSVGDTIAEGQRQSRLNQLTAQVERVMRRDFQNMTRDGFLVIRNEWAVATDGAVSDNDGDGISDRFNVPAFPGDPGPRPRRVDQIMFFARDQFETARAPVQPGMIARSTEARVWYGHGQRKYEGDDLAFPDTYLDPRLDDTMQGYNITDGAALDRLGYDPPDPGVLNPNQYAADWTLLRHVTLLIPPADPMAQALPDFGSDGLYGYPVDRLDDTGGFRTGVSDGEFQVALQPALPGVFWSSQLIDEQWASAGNPDVFGYVRDYDPNQNPAYLTGVPRVVDIAYDEFTNGTHPSTPPNLREVGAARSSSGLVDIATTSLAEIESIVTAADFNVYQVGDGIINSAPGVLDYREFDALIQQERNGGFFPNTLARRKRPWLWMVDALPVPPDAVPPPGYGGPHSDQELIGGFISSSLPEPHRDRTSARIRYEPTPPNPTAGPDSLTPRDRIQGVYEQADQEILTRWAFLPRCTEFIVEWTYGWVYDDNQPTSSPYYTTPGEPHYKQTVWFGRERHTVDTDGDGVINANLDRPTVVFYQPQDTGADPWNPPADQPPRSTITGLSPADTANFPFPADPETAAFGYLLPLDDGTAIPGQPGGGGVVLRPWPWPTQIRVTMSLADPSDPGIESTLEVIFDVPEADGGGGV